MKNTVIFNNFIFLNIKFRKYHHTDQQKGAPLYYLAYMIKGKAKIVSENATIHINEGEVFYIPKNLPYHSYWYGNDEIEFLSFGFSSLMTNEDLNAGLQKVECSKEVIDKICGINTSGRNVDCRTLCKFYDVMDIITTKLKNSYQNNEKIIVERIKDYIKENPYVTLLEIASACAISESYLYFLFKKIMHITPNDYRQKILCEKAVELLLTTEKKVEEISDILNFSSSSYFRKILKKHTKSTPREIRNNRGF